jgi:hypothetical protein
MVDTGFNRHRLSTDSNLGVSPDQWVHRWFGGTSECPVARCSHSYCTCCRWASVWGVIYLGAFHARLVLRSNLSRYSVRSKPFDWSRPNRINLHHKMRRSHETQARPPNRYNGATRTQVRSRRSKSSTSAFGYREGSPIWQCAERLAGEQSCGLR